MHLVTGGERSGPMVTKKSPQANLLHSGHRSNSRWGPQTIAKLVENNIKQLYRSINS